MLKNSKLLRKCQGQLYMTLKLNGILKFFLTIPPMVGYSKTRVKYPCCPINRLLHWRKPNKFELLNEPTRGRFFQKVPLVAEGI